MSAYNWSGSLAIGESVNFDIDTSFTPNSTTTYNIDVYIELANSVTDQVATNDTSKISNTQFNALPIVNITTVLDANYCSNNDDEVVVLNATPTNGISTFTTNGGEITNFDPTEYLSGTVEIICTFTDEIGCSNTDTVSTYINDPPTADAGNIKTIEEGHSTSLSGSASGGTTPYTYSWTPTDKVISPNSSSTSTTELNGTVLFTLTVDDANNCTDEDTVSVLVTSTPTPALTSSISTNNDTICLGESVTIINTVGGG
jgi:hypothetical protein